MPQQRASIDFPIRKVRMNRNANLMLKIVILCSSLFITVWLLWILALRFLSVVRRLCSLLPSSSFYWNSVSTLKQVILPHLSHVPEWEMEVSTGLSESVVIARLLKDMEKVGDITSPSRVRIVESGKLNSPTTVSLCVG